MMSISENIQSIDMLELPSGSYWIEIKSDTSVSSHMIIKS